MNFEPLRALMETLVAEGVPGCELAVCRGHKVLFHECAGFSDAARLRPATPFDRYLLCSCTKPVTAVAAMQCLERGLIALDDPVEKYLPHWANVRVRDGETLRAPRTAPTVRHLLTMTAGLDYNLNRPWLADFSEGSAREIADRLGGDPLDFDPGARFQYSLCHDVLGGVIEAASGMTLRDFMRRNIFEPLGMTRTDFQTGSRPNPHLAALYEFDPSSRRLAPRSGQSEFAFLPNFFSGGSGLTSCVEDYLLFADALACGGVGADGSRILRPETIDLMRTEQLPAFRVDGSFSCTCGSDYGYGLGVRTRVAFDNGTPGGRGEFGWDGAAGADLTVDPANRLSMVYMQHVRGWPDMLGCIHLRLLNALDPELLAER